MRNERQAPVRAIRRRAGPSAGIAVLLAVCSCGPEPPSPHSLSGTWEGRHGAYDIFLRFSADSTCELRFERADTDWVLDVLGRYAVDATKRPAALTITGTQWFDHDLYTIVQLTGPDAMKLGLFAPVERLRPVTFRPAIYLARREAGSRGGQRSD
jgi:hypothetical protein